MNCLDVQVLRSLFERLGATYIKLGQFIASSPSLFPPEYVLEFQKCLDKTTPVPYEVGIVELARGSSPSIETCWIRSHAEMRMF